MIGIIVQARMSSNRLPGKVMKKILGKPMIFYLLERLKYCKNTQKIIVATPNKKTDYTLHLYVKKLGYTVFRGSETDVLKRYFLAALTNRLTDVVRITADCPLVEPNIIDKLVIYYKLNKLDYAYLSPNFAEGLDAEIFSFNALKKAFFNANLVSEREHVTQYFHTHKDKFHIGVMPNNGDDSKIRITIDEPEDLLVIKAIYKALYNKQKPIFSFKQVKMFLKQNQDVYSLNRNIIRNEGLIISLKNDKKTY